MQIMTESNRLRLANLSPLVRIPKIGTLNRIHDFPKYYPSATIWLFAKVWGGYVDHWSNNPGGPTIKNGWGLTFGGGYDFPLNKNFLCVPTLLKNYGTR